MPRKSVVLQEVSHGLYVGHKEEPPCVTGSSPLHHTALCETVYLGHLQSLEKW